MLNNEQSTSDKVVIKLRSILPYNIVSIHVLVKPLSLLAKNKTEAFFSLVKNKYPQKSGHLFW